MVSLTSYNLINGFFLLSVFVGLTMSLKCYICHTNDNSLCTDEFLQECPSNQAYDRCITKTYKNPADGLHIKKECALAPCYLSFLKFKQECDPKQEDCVFCCPDDGCNKDGVPYISTYNYFTIIMIIVGSLSFILNNTLM